MDKTEVNPRLNDNRPRRQSVKKRSIIATIIQSKTYEELMTDVKAQVLKSFYKSAYYDICRNSKAYTSYEEIINVRSLQIIIMMKIVKRKLRKYNLTSTRLNPLFLVSIDKWLKEIENTIEMLVLHIFPDFNQIPNLSSFKEKTSIIIQIIDFYIEYCYINAIINKQFNRIEKTCAYISISLKIIEETFGIITNPRTLNTIQKTYLLTINIFLNNRDYLQALHYQEKVIESCFREFLIRVDFYQGLQDNIINHERKSIFDMIFHNISIAFCQRGICKESIGKITKSIEAYKQSKWFGMKFLYESNSVYCKLICNIVKRSNEYHHIITRIRSYLKAIENEKDNEPGIDKNAELNEIMSHIAKGNYADMKKDKKADEFISLLNPDEIDVPYSYHNEKRKIDQYANKTKSKSEYMLGNVRLLDTYQSRKFKKSLSKLKEINLAYFDPNTKEKLEREINKVAKENLRTSENCKSTEQKNLYMKNTTHTIQCKTYHNNYQDQKLLTSSNSHMNNALKTNNNMSLFTDQSNVNILTSRSKKSSSIKGKVEKYSNKNNDPNYFSEEYLNKVNYLDRLENKEIKFQKKVLSLRTNEKYPLLIKDRETVENDALRTFYRLKHNISRNNPNPLIFQPNITHETRKNFERYKMLENSVFKSLSPKHYEDLMKERSSIIRKKKVKKNDSSEEEDYEDKASIYNKNDAMMKRITIDIEMVNSKSKETACHSSNKKQTKTQHKTSIAKLFNLPMRHKREYEFEQFTSITPQNEYYL